MGNAGGMVLTAQLGQQISIKLSFFVHLSQELMLSAGPFLSSRVMQTEET
jgi:hypothetical protein